MKTTCDYLSTFDKINSNGSVCISTFEQLWNLRGGKRLLLTWKGGGEVENLAREWMFGWISALNYPGMGGKVTWRGGKSFSGWLVVAQIALRQLSAFSSLQTAFRSANCAKMCP